VLAPVADDGGGESGLRGALPVYRVGGTGRAGQNRWETIRYALDQTSRTIPLCVILIVSSAATAVPFLILALARRWLG
jgi:hypothetical protein